jgi:hypothetical protein
MGSGQGAEVNPRHINKTLFPGKLWDKIRLQARASAEWQFLIPKSGI